jgi:hypothetical protein
MAEPESAVLPITPYPIGCLKPLVRAYSADQNNRLPAFWNRRCQPLSADVQTTKDFPPDPQAWSSPQPSDLLTSRLFSADYGIGESSDALDRDGDSIAILDGADAGGCSGEDEIAGQQGHHG